MNKYGKVTYGKSYCKNKLYEEEEIIMKRKLTVTMLTAALAVSTLAGCTGGTKPAGTGSSGGAVADGKGEVQELQFWGWWSSEARKPYVQKMVDGFNESQDKYHVTYVDIPFGDIFTKNIAQIAAGNPCDIMANSMEEVRFRASQGQVESLDEFLTDK